MMKIYKTQLQFGIWLAACMPLASHAAMELPYWLSAEWIATKISDFHTRNTDRVEQVQKQEKQEKQEKLKTQDHSIPTNASNGVAQPATERAPRKPKLAPVEFATPKINEKYLSKEELYELRMQLKQQP